MQGRGTAADNQPAHPEKSRRHFEKTRSDFVQTRSHLNFSRSDLVSPRPPPRSSTVLPHFLRPTQNHPPRARRSNKIRIFAHESQRRSHSGGGEAGFHISGKAFIGALYLAYLNFANSNPSSGNKATVDAHWVCYMPARSVPPAHTARLIHIYTYRRGLLRCSFYDGGQCEGPDTRDGNDTDSRAFSYIYATTHQNLSDPGSLAETTRKLLWKSLSKTGSIRSLANVQEIGCVKRPAIGLRLLTLPWMALLHLTLLTPRGFHFSTMIGNGE